MGKSPRKGGRTTETMFGMMSLDLIEDPPKNRIHNIYIYIYIIYNVGKTMSETIPQSSPFPQENGW